MQRAQRSQRVLLRNERNWRTRETQENYARKYEHRRRSLRMEIRMQARNERKKNTQK